MKISGSAQRLIGSETPLRPREVILGGLLCGLLLLPVVFSAKQAYQRESAVSAIIAAGGAIRYETLDQSGSAPFDPATTPTSAQTSSWTREVMAQSSGHSIVAVSLAGDEHEIPFEALESLHRLRELVLIGVHLDETDVERLAALDRLRRLRLEQVEISADHLDRLRNRLPECQVERVAP